MQNVKNKFLKMMILWTNENKIPFKKVQQLNHEAIRYSKNIYICTQDRSSFQMTVLSFGLTLVVLPKSSAGPKKMDAKISRHFWHFSIFDAECLFTNSYLVKIYRTKVMHIYKFYPQISEFWDSPFLILN